MCLKGVAVLWRKLSTSKNVSVSTILCVNDKPSNTFSFFDNSLDVNLTTRLTRFVLYKLNDSPLEAVLSYLQTYQAAGRACCTRSSKSSGTSGPIRLPAARLERSGRAPALANCNKNESCWRGSCAGCTCGTAPRTPNFTHYFESSKNTMKIEVTTRDHSRIRFGFEWNYGDAKWLVTREVEHPGFERWCSKRCSWKHEPQTIGGTDRCWTKIKLKNFQ